MATLAQMSDRARRKMGLGLGSHTITLTYASIADGDTITVSGVVLTCQTDANPPYELANFKKETDASATADNLEDLIDAIFDGTTGVSSASSAGVVTITGARSVTTDNSSGFAISSSTYQDEPPYTSDFDQWILDGGLDVADKVTDSALMAGDTGLMEVFSLTGDGTAVAIAKSGSNTHTVTCVSAVANDYVDINGVRFTAETAAAMAQVSFDVGGNDAADGVALEAAIDNVFLTFTGISADDNGAGVVTITGAKTVTSSNATRLAVTLTTDVSMLRPVEVRAKIDSDTALYKLKYVEPGVMLAIRQNDHSYYKVDTADKAQKYWSMWDDKIQFSAAPVSGSDMAQIIGIKTPQTTKTNESDMPPHLQPLIEDYAVIQAYIQMQRMDYVQMLYQKYMADIAAINRQYGD